MDHIPTGFSESFVKHSCTRWPSHQQEASSCSNLAEVAGTILIGRLNVIHRRFIQSSSKFCLTFPTPLYGLFTRWMLEIQKIQEPFHLESQLRENRIRPHNLKAEMRNVLLNNASKLLFFRHKIITTQNSDIIIKRHVGHVRCEDERKRPQICLSHYCCYSWAAFIQLQWDSSHWAVAVTLMESYKFASGSHRTSPSRPQKKSSE